MGVGAAVKEKSLDMRFAGVFEGRGGMPRFQLGFEELPKEIEMSASGHSESFIERNWSWFVIALGVIFVACIDIFAPTL